MPNTLPVTVLVMPFPDPENKAQTLPATIWWAQFTATDGAALSARVEFHGFRDEAAFLTWFADHTQAQEIGMKPYTVEGAAFLTLYSAVFSKQVAFVDAVLSLTQIADTPTGAVDAQNQPVLRPFFQGAAPQTIQVPLST